MKIKITGLQYLFDTEGNTSSVNVSYQSYEGTDNFNASVQVKSSQIDRMTKSDLDKEARKKIQEWLK